MENGTGSITNTLFSDLRALAFLSKTMPHICNDKKAAELSEKLPQQYFDISGEDELSIIYKGAKADQIDFNVRRFLAQNPSGIIAVLGAGLGTAYYRNDTGGHIWYEIDQPEIISLRNTVFGQQDRDQYLAYSPFSKDWYSTVKANGRPVLFIAAGLLCNYTEDRAVDLMKDLSSFPNAEIIFEAPSRSGKEIMKKCLYGSESADTSQLLAVDDPVQLVRKIGNNARVVSFDDLFGIILDRKGLSLGTKYSMMISNMLNRVEFVHLKLS